MGYLPISVGPDIKISKSTTNNDMPFKSQCSLSTSNTAKKVISPKLQLHLPTVITTEPLSVKTETLIDLTAPPLLTMVEKLCLIVTLLTNEMALQMTGLRVKICDLKRLLASTPGLPAVTHMDSAVGSLSSKAIVMMHKNITASSQPALWTTPNAENPHQPWY
jgi:hypothetical protein